MNTTLLVTVYLFPSLIDISLVIKATDNRDSSIGDGRGAVDDDNWSSIKIGFKYLQQCYNKPRSVERNSSFVTRKKRVDLKPLLFATLLFKEKQKNTRMKKINYYSIKPIVIN